jgi:hypothetical protein
MQRMFIRWIQHIRHIDTLILLGKVSQNGLPDSIAKDTFGKSIAKTDFQIVSQKILFITS